MARRAGLGIFLLCGGSAVLIAVAAVWTGSLYGVAALFLLVMAGLGLLQVFTGRHIITGRGR